MDKHEPPKTMREAGIVLAYMQRDISEMKQLMKEQGGFYATKHELADVNERIDETNERIDKIEKARLKEANDEEDSKPKSKPSWIDNPKVQAVLGAAAVTLAAIGAWFTAKAG